MFILKPGEENMGRIQVVTCLILFYTASNLFGGIEFAKAIKEGDAKKVEEIIKKDPKLVNTEISSYGLPLFLAVGKGEVEIVTLLLENGANIKELHPQSKDNVVFRLLESPQTEANLKKAIEIIGLLKEKKADFNAINNENMTPLYYFSTGSNTKKSIESKVLFIEALIKAGAKLDIKLKRDEPLLNAVLMKVIASDPTHIEIAKLLIKHGAPINGKSSKKTDCAERNTVTEDDTPLIIVIKRDGFQTATKTEMIKLLVENGAKITSRNKKGETPKKLLDKRDSFYRKNLDALKKTKVLRKSK